MAVILFACSGDPTAPGSRADAHAFWALRLNVHAVDLGIASPQNTTQLTATAIDAAGTPLPEDYTVTYSTHDSNATVSPTGLVTARFATLGQATSITATLKLQNETLADTALIRIDSFSVPVATYSIQPLPLDLDSAKDAIDDQGRSVNNGLGNIPLYVTNTRGDSVCNVSACALAVYFTSSDPTVATIDRTTGTIIPQRIGHVTFYVTSLAYGVVKRDSLLFIIGNALNSSVRVFSQTSTVKTADALYFSPSPVIVGVGGSVRFFNFAPPADSIDVEFDDSTAVQGGNIPPVAGFLFAIRNFPVAGTYRFHSRFFQTGGTVIVMD